MARACWALLVALLAGSEARAVELSLGPRPPLLVYVVRGRESEGAGAGTLLAEVDRALEAGGELTARAPEELSVDRGALEACPPVERLSCWTAIVDGRAHWLLALVVHGGAGKEQLSALLVPVGPALGWLEAARRRGGQDWREAAEQRIYARVVQSALQSVDTRDPSALRRYFARLLQQELASSLAEGTVGFGRLLLRGAPPGALLDIDGEPLGAVPQASLQVRDVPPGLHRVRLRAEGRDERLETVMVERARTTTVAFASVRSGRPVLGWALAAGGAAAAVIGGVLLGVAASLDGGALRSACLVRPGADASCPGLGAPGFGWSPERAPSTDPAEVNGGLGLAPLGWGLVASGTTWALAGWLTEDEAPPWMALLGGVVAGVAAYGLGSWLHAR